MKQLYACIALSVVLIPSVDAQNYQPLLDSINIWNYSSSPLVVRMEGPSTIQNAPCIYPAYFTNTKMQYTVQDTVIDSLTYKIVREEVDLNPNACDFGYVREDTAARKVYFRDNLGNPEILLYDFTLTIGDTFPVNFIFNGGLYTSGTYTVDSIYTFNTISGQTRMFCLNNHNFPWSPVLYWAEGIGCMMNMFYTHSINQWGSGSAFWSCRYYPQNAMEFLTCFDHYQKIYYDSCKHASALSDGCFLTTDSCSYWNICGSIDENQLAADISIFPAPATECINVSVETKEPGEFTFVIYDINGNLVINRINPLIHSGGKQLMHIDISALNSGSYLLHCSKENKTLSVPFIVK